MKKRITIFFLCLPLLSLAKNSFIPHSSPVIDCEQKREKLESRISELENRVKGKWNSGGLEEEVDRLESDVSTLLKRMNEIENRLTEEEENGISITKKDTVFVPVVAVPGYEYYRTDSGERIRVMKATENTVWFITIRDKKGNNLFENELEKDVPENEWEKRNTKDFYKEIYDGEWVWSPI